MTHQDHQVFSPGASMQEKPQSRIGIRRQHLPFADVSFFCSFSRFQQILRPTKRKENCRATKGIEEGMDSQDDPVGIKHDQTTIDVTMSMLVSVKEIAGFLNGDLTESCPS
jgi:hypothetical protein